MSRDGPPITQRTSGLTIDAAHRIPDEYGLTFDWLYRGDRSTLPHKLAIDIARIEAAEREHQNIDHYT
jgi:hypothetical protein